jgi:hypothetical protein
VTNRPNTKGIISWEGVFSIRKTPKGVFLEASLPGGKKISLPLHLGTQYTPPEGVYGFGGGRVEEAFNGQRHTLGFVLKFFHPGKRAPKEGKEGGVWLSGLFRIKRGEGGTFAAISNASVRVYHKSADHLPEGTAYLRAKVAGHGTPFLLLEHIFYLEKEGEAKVNEGEVKAEETDIPDIELPPEPPF